jgi:hypothetical protein
MASCASTVPQDAMQRADRWRAVSEADHGAAPGLMRSAPLGDGEQASPTAQHAATHERQDSGQRVTPTSGASMIRDGGQGTQQRWNLG